jgi:hypothetical protein
MWHEAVLSKRNPQPAKGQPVPAAILRPVAWWRAVAVLAAPFGIFLATQAASTTPSFTSVGPLSGSFSLSVATAHEQNIYNAPGNGPYASSLDVTETTAIFTNTAVTEHAKAEGYAGRPTLQPQQQNLSIRLKSFSSVSVRSGDHIGSVSGGAQAEARSQLFVPVMVAGLPTGTIGTMTLRLNLDGNISGEGNKTNMTDVVPPPGAVKGAFVSNSLDNTDVTHAGWPTLPGYQAVNFAKDGSLTPVVVDLSGTTQNAIELVRVWGEPAWELGAYWTMQAPKTEDDFYGQAAIALPWNSGRYLGTLISGGRTGQVLAWRGTAARQPALDADQKVVDGYYLPGGVTQIFIPNGMLPYIGVGPTAWHTPSTAALAVIEKPIPNLQPPAKGAPAVVDHARALADLVGYLARLLEAAGNEGAGGPTGPLAQQVALLRRSAAALQTAPPDRIRSVAQALIPLGRYLDGFPPAHGRAATVEAAVAEVIRWAYAIGVDSAT